MKIRFISKIRVLKLFGGASCPVMGAVFKTVSGLVRAGLGGFDSHTPPPVLEILSMIKRCPNLAPAKWIEVGTTPHATSASASVGNPITVCIPPIYPIYLKILHPIYEDLSITDRSVSWNDLRDVEMDDKDPVAKLLSETTFVYGGEFDRSALKRITWKELAAQQNLIFHPEINADSFTRKFTGRSWPRYLIGPEEGFLDEQSCRNIVNSLEPFTGGKKCYFLFDLITTDDYESDLLFEGLVQDIFEVRHVEKVHASPTAWWPEDQSWLVYTDYDLTFTLFGGSGAAAEMLTANPDLECIVIEPQHRVDYQADRLNP